MVPDPIFVHKNDLIIYLICNFAFQCSSREGWDANPQF